MPDRLYKVYKEKRITYAIEVVASSEAEAISEAKWQGEWFEEFSETYDYWVEDEPKPLDDEDPA